MNNYPEWDELRVLILHFFAILVNSREGSIPRRAGNETRGDDLLFLMLQEKQPVRAIIWKIDGQDDLLLDSIFDNNSFFLYFFSVFGYIFIIFFNIKKL